MTSDAHSRPSHAAWVAWGGITEATRHADSAPASLTRVRMRLPGPSRPGSVARLARQQELGRDEARAVLGAHGKVGTLPVGGRFVERKARILALRVQGVVTQV